MDILDIIKSDHDKVLGIFDDMEKMESKTASARDRPFQTLISELTKHMDAEEKVFYPALESKHRDDVLEAIEEHNVARTVSDQMDNAEKDTDTWMAKLKVLKELIEHHIEEEEGKIFDEARKDLSKDRLSDLGREFEDAKAGTMKASRSSARAGKAI
ncbi:MAG TPA: hemerythrin domain-containing protein [Methanotrichaceae archaeon]|nr:hemerythrin domain-containing protein [Methanotrichaceae archaeon]